ncbi:MAG: hypothetical protein WDO18_02215 [Acidobacteriota bacterium]
MNKARQHDLDDLGIARRRVKRRSGLRDQKLKDEQMMKLYRQHVLGEKPMTDMVSLDSIAPGPKVDKQKEVVRSETNVRGYEGCSSGRPVRKHPAFFNWAADERGETHFGRRWTQMNADS